MYSTANWSNPQQKVLWKLLSFHFMPKYLCCIILKEKLRVVYTTLQFAVVSEKVGHFSYLNMTYGAVDQSDLVNGRFGMTLKSDWSISPMFKTD